MAETLFTLSFQRHAHHQSVGWHRPDQRVLSGRTIILSLHWANSMPGGTPTRRCAPTSLISSIIAQPVFALPPTRNVSWPGRISIRHEDATAQWMFTNAPGRQHLYPVIGDGRRLRYNNSVLDLAPPGTTGSVVEWNFNGPDSNGYYFIDNYNGTETLSGSGSGGSISISVVASGRRRITRVSAL